MKSIADQLPPEIATQLHPDRRKNEAEYWAVRDQLLDQYRGHWIGFADGLVIASGSSPVSVFHAAEASGRHPFIICIGREDEPCRIRRACFPYDAGYPKLRAFGKNENRLHYCRESAAPSKDERPSFPHGFRSSLLGAADSR